MREAQKMAVAPTTPYVGLYLTDLTFLEESDSNLKGVRSTKGKPLLNYQKFVKIGQVLALIKQKQFTKFEFQENRELIKKLSRLQTISEDEMTKASKNIE